MAPDRCVYDDEFTYYTARDMAAARAGLSAANQLIGGMKAEAEILRRKLDAAQAEIAELKQELKQTEK